MSHIPKPGKDGIRRYGAWIAGGREGVHEDVSRCVVEVYDRDSRCPHYSQCKRKRGHGPDGLYCKQHDPDAVERRRKESDERFRYKIDNLPEVRLSRALKRIEELEQEIAKLKKGATK